MAIDQNLRQDAAPGKRNPPAPLTGAGEDADLIPADNGYDALKAYLALQASDTTSIRHGSQQFGNRSMSMAANAANPDTVQTQRLLEEKKRRWEEEDRREMDRIAAWKAGKVNLGGIEMTNEEALDALQEANKDPDKYVQRAIERGEIENTDAAKEKLKREMKELEDFHERIRCGEKLSSAQEQRKKELENGNAGKVAADARDHIKSIQNKANYGPAENTRNTNAITSVTDYKTDDEEIERRRKNGSLVSTASSEKEASTGASSVANQIDGNPIGSATIRPVFAEAVTVSETKKQNPQMTIAASTLKSSGLDLG